MFHLIPAPLHRQLFRIAHRLRGVWRRWSGRPSRGVAVIAHDGAGRILLVRHSYGSGRWALPGGGLGRGEDPVECARRELHEELSCQLAEISLFEIAERTIQGSLNRGYIFHARLVGEPLPDGREIVEAGWFEPSALPGEMIRLSREQVERWLADQSSES